jgi:hypothetical protein
MLYSGIDAAALSELLWVNSDRLLQCKAVRALRQVDFVSSTDQANRSRTTLHKEAGGARTCIVNKIKQILRRHNFIRDTLQAAFLLKMK